MGQARKESECDLAILSLSHCRTSARGHPQLSASKRQEKGEVYRKNEGYRKREAVVARKC